MNPLLYLLSTTCAHPCYFPTPPDCSKVAQKIDEDTQEFLEDYRSTRHILPPVNYPCEGWSLKITYSSAILYVSIEYEYISLYNKVLSLDTIVICHYICDLTSWAHI